MRRRNAPGVRVALPAVVLGLVLLSLGCFLAARAATAHDQLTGARRRAGADRLRAEILLERAKSYLVGLSELLGSEPTAGQARFAFLAGTTITSFDLVDALWIQRSGGRLVARYGTTVPPGTDISRSSALAAPISSQGTVFAGAATRLGSLHGAPGFWLVQSGRFGSGANSAGYLAMFVPRGWMTLSLQDDPRQAEVLLDGQRLEGAVSGSPVAVADFLALGQVWRIRVDAPPPSTVESALPWLALGWPWLAGLLAVLVGTAILRRRRAEHEVDRIFDLSLDLLGIARHDGVFVHVNPAFTRTLGYTAAELTSRPYMDFVLPEDHARTLEAHERLVRGEQLVQFENRYRRRDGSVCWLEWSVHPVPNERLTYAAARDVTARREAEERVRETELSLRASRDELRLLADEQAALRRVATLVARGVTAHVLFDAVVREACMLLAADAALLLRCDRDQVTVVAATTTMDGLTFELASRAPIGDDRLAAEVRQRIDAGADDELVSLGAPAPRLREQGLHTAAAAPIAVDGALWGVIEAAWGRPLEVPAATAQRLTDFAELVVTAIANAHSRAELTASRARVVAAADEVRRRIERDLHDGTQQRLVALALALRVAEAQVPPEFEDLRERISATAEGLAAAVSDLQEFSRGIHPAILSRGGLDPALRALARRSTIAVELETAIGGRIDPAMEVAAYYLVSEALTNATKHSGASRVEIHARTSGSSLAVTIRDDGQGGADPTRGSGLLGLMDRVHAIGGTLEIHSEYGHGTSLHADFPLAPESEPGRSLDPAERDPASTPERLGA